MDISSKIYLPGHLGLVGSAINRTLSNRGYNNLILKSIDELDLTRQTQTEEFLGYEKPDYVFLAAAKVGGILANSKYQADFIYENLQIASNVIHASFKSGVKKLLNLGSSCIYPKFAPQPMKETDLLTGILEPTNEPYAIAKIAAIKLCRYFNEQYGTDYISVMPTNLYGFNDNFNLETSHVLPALIRKIELARLLATGKYDNIIEDINKRPLGYGILINEFQDINSIKNTFLKIGISAEKVELWGTGNVYREFLHADDMAEACVFLMENYSYKDLGEFINIGSGTDITIKDLAIKVKELIGYDGAISFNPSNPEGTPKKLLDVSKLFSLGWEPKISLGAGLSQVINNYRNA
ncbi:MAG: GDP-L-fucose synthase [Candidatus Kapabacteria bacterium]|nr:GDP-L-fucose synthase [Candidatus Kapabacteria bacterium]